MLSSVHPDYLIASVESMGAGFAVYDASDRLVAFNRRYQILRDTVGGQARLGTSWQESAADTVKRGSIPEALGRDEEWLRRRRAVRGRYSSLRPWPDGRLIQIHERKTPDGGVAVIWAEVSKAIRSDPFLLTHRERQVLSLLGRRASIGEAADALGISRRSVGLIQYRLMDRHHLKTSTDLIEYAMANGLLALPTPLPSTD